MLASGTLTINAPIAANISQTGGNLTLNTLINGAISQTGGNLLLAISNSTYAVPVTMNNSSLAIADNSPHTITNTIPFSGNCSISSGSNANASLTLAGGFAGSGILNLTAANLSSPSTIFPPRSHHLHRQSASDRHGAIL